MATALLDGSGPPSRTTHSVRLQKLLRNFQRNVTPDVSDTPQWQWTPSGTVNKKELKASTGPLMTLDLNPIKYP